MSTNNRVAIIGSGPAGLICATKLAGNGYRVTVFDELNEFGGMLAYGIPEFRLSLDIVREKINDAKKEGIEFKKKKITSIKELLKWNRGEFDFVVLAIGAGAGQKSGAKGENNPLVLDGLDFLLKTKLEGKKLVNSGEIVGVVGGGNSAMDAARSAKRMGANVKIIYRRTQEEMPALESEVKGTKEDGVEFDFLLNPVEYKSKKLLDGRSVLDVICSKMILGEIDKSGRRSAIDSGQMITKEFDKVILAVGQKQELSWLEKEGIKTNGKSILVDENTKTTLSGVYACGDCVTGAKTIKEATMMGLRTAQAIISANSQSIG